MTAVARGLGDSKHNRERPVPEAAADWYLYFEDQPNLTEAQRVRFVEWLRRSPLHIEEFLRVGGLRAEIAGLPPDGMPEIEKLVAAARENVVELESGRPDSGSVAAHALPSRRGRWYAAAAALLLTIAGSLYLLAPTDIVPASYATGLGEQRSILLSDGSVVVLNTTTRIDVRFTSSNRRIRLHAGEAVFEVAPDSGRPLRVTAGPAEVVAIGTRFNVYLQDEQTIVTVMEGRVAVSSVARPARPDHLAPDTPGTMEVHQGNQVTVRPRAPVDEPRAVDVAAATAWRDRRLIFDGTTLAGAVREINRYNHKKLALADAELAAQRISGVFAANKPEAMVTFLKAVGNVRCEEVDGGWLIHSNSPESAGSTSSTAPTGES